MTPLDESLLKQAEDAKTEGNASFAKGSFDDAVASYSLGLVAVDRLVPPPTALKATLLSNRAMCHLKTMKLQACIDDCSSAVALQPDAPLRGKLLFRRAKARFLLHNLNNGSGGGGNSDNDDLLQDAAKDLLELISKDPNNGEANQLLRSIRAQHAQQKTASTPVSKTLEALRKINSQQKQTSPRGGEGEKDTPHHLKVLIGLVDNDTSNASMELGRLNGVDLLLDLVTSWFSSLSTPNGKSSCTNPKLAIWATQCVSASACHPAFVRAYLASPSIQTRLCDLVQQVVTASQQLQQNQSDSQVEDVLVSLLAVYDRILLHLDRDDPNVDIGSNTGIDAATLVQTCRTALQCNSSSNSSSDGTDPTSKTVVRAVLDVLRVWTAGTDRDAAIRASLLGTNAQDPLLPPPVTESVIRAMSPQETAAFRKREYEKKLRDEAWAYERGVYFAQSGLLKALLQTGTTCRDHVVRREITVTVSRILAGVLGSKDDDTKLKEIIQPFLNSGSSESGGDSKPGVVIEELYNDDGDEKDDDVEEEVDSVETMMERAIVAAALLMSINKEVAAWSMGSGGWKTCTDDLPRMIDSNDPRAMCLASEVISGCATVESAKGIIEGLMVDGSIQTLLSSPDRDIRSGAASAIAKVGLADKATRSDEAEVMALLQGACDLLEDRGDSADKLVDDKKGTSKLHHFSSFATSSIERGIEMMTYLVANTVVKEEMTAGFRVPGAHSTALERLVEISSLPKAGESLSGFGLATIFQHLAVTNLQLRKEMFAGKEVTMDQYDDMQKLGKTQEEKDIMEQEKDPDTEEACNERILKMANANVPRAMVTLMEGASDHTLEQLVMCMNRMAGEPAARGIMVQQGILSACIKVEKIEGPTETDTMCKAIQLARHCIAKILITTNPSLITSAQRLGSVRPLIQLVRDLKATDLQHFEALLAITNIAGSGEDAKNRIVSEKGIGPLHFAMFDDHDMVQRAATEAMSNLVPHKAMMDHLVNPENLRLWLAFASDYEERYDSARAAAGCLAMATQDESIALALVGLEKFDTHMTALVQSGRLEIMHRTFYIILNLVTHGGTCREKVHSEGLADFCRIYIDKYHNNQGTEELEFSEAELALLPVTVDLAKKIVKLTDNE